MLCKSNRRPFRPCLLGDYFGIVRTVTCNCGLLLHRHKFSISGLILDLIVVGTLKVAVRRNRPSHNRGKMKLGGPGDFYSFPSGHTTRAFMVKILMPAHVLWTVAAVSVACSRVVLGRHYVSDVVFGALIGLGEGCMVLGSSQGVVDVVMDWRGRFLELFA